MTKTVKAKVTPVPFGVITVDGLMLPDGSFGISVSQAAELLHFATPNNATKAVKALLGKGFPLSSSG
jgi:hypothetical protein